MSMANNSEANARTRQQVEKLDAGGFYHSFLLPDGSSLHGQQTHEQLMLRLSQFAIPEDLRGKRVLDIGAWDGWFSFEMEKRGASVVAVDLIERNTFKEVHALLDSKVEFRVDDILNLTPDRYGVFDIVLFLGVLYHLKHPLLALERVCALSTGMVCVESYVCSSNLDEPPIMEFYENDELCGQFDNWVGPNVTCLLALCRTAGFADVRLKSVLNQRAHVSCFRKWNERAANTEAPRITAVENSLRGGRHFRRWPDEYVSVWFKSDAIDLTCNDVYAGVGSFGVKVAGIHATGGDGWMTSFIVPPGLPDGVHEVTIATRDSKWSVGARISVGQVDLPDVSIKVFENGPIEILTIADGKSWDRSVACHRPEVCISFWVKGLSPSASSANVKIRSGETQYPSMFLSLPDEAGVSQVNVILPPEFPAGDHEFSIRCGDTCSPPRSIRIL